MRQGQTKHWQLLMVQDLILALKADNIETCFILSGISFHSLGPKVDIALVPKCAIPQLRP